MIVLFVFVNKMMLHVIKSDLSTLSEQNSGFKYDDDTTLLVPEHTDTNINDEFEHIQVWATANKLVINQDYVKKLSSL